jgi:hypothetical protein
MTGSFMSFDPNRIIGFLVLSGHGVRDGSAWNRRRASAMAGFCCVTLAACSPQLLPSENPPEAKSPPPSQQIIERTALDFIRGIKLPGKPEVSQLRRAMISAPADWVICVRSNAPPYQPYAIFMNGNTVVHYRLAVVYDDCAHEIYVPVVDPAEAAK